MRGLATLGHFSFGLVAFAGHVDIAAAENKFKRRRQMILLGLSKLAWIAGKIAAGFSIQQALIAPEHCSVERMNLVTGMQLAKQPHHPIEIMRCCRRLLRHVGTLTGRRPIAAIVRAHFSFAAMSP
ncbi:MAG: hypothetical protein WAU79_19440, partial [Bradyrhizobium sp.]|uniref:hypothetical protein n=1 Tax=Bradyrhizobium sp. TaxID=376 RepID=UPI003BB1107E